MTPLDIPGFAEDLLNSRVILIGETHSVESRVNNKMHELVRDAVRKLVSEGRDITLGIEHLPRYTLPEERAINMLVNDGYSMLAETARPLIDKWPCLHLFFFGCTPALNRQYANIIQANLRKDSVCVAIMGNNHLDPAQGVPAYLESDGRIMVIKQKPSERFPGKSFAIGGTPIYTLADSPLVI